MLRDFVTTSNHVHAEYLRRRASPPEPLEQPRHGLRKAIGQTLIQLGERLAQVDRHQTVEEAA